jgi:glutamate dehydrogenase
MENYAPSSSDDLNYAVKQEGEKFQEFYLWLEQAMSTQFFHDVTRENLMLITHSLMGFDLQDNFSIINLKSAAVVLCLDSPDADLKILRNYLLFGIKNYQTYVSNTPLPNANAPIRIAMIEFMGAQEKVKKPFSEEAKVQLRALVEQENEFISTEEFNRLLTQMSPPFLHALPIERLALAIDMLYRAQSRDNIQLQVRYVDHPENKDDASMHLVFAWRNTPVHDFLYRIARMIHRHGLTMKRVNATYMNPYSKNSVLVMALSLHGSNGESVRDVADIPDFLREISTIKYFNTLDKIDEHLVTPRIITGNMGNLIRAMVNFIHQALVHIDTNLYTIDNIEEALYRHPELTKKLCDTFRLKFDPNFHNLEEFNIERQKFLDEVAQLDTGQESNDLRRKNVLNQGMNFISHTLKTNFYRLNYTALSFRLDPAYLDHLPFDRSKKFPELPYAIFFMRGMHFFGFHIRFVDLARGGLRTVFPEQLEQMIAERNNVFTECYSLAWTQHKKNKDIPEGGAKGLLFLKPFNQIDQDSQILKRELEWMDNDAETTEQKVQAFRQEQKWEYLYQSQRAYIESLITIVNCDPDGKIRAKHIIDYWKRPEYIYLGPDENMHDFMIEWIADFSKKYHYKPGGAFISSKPDVGINHKEYGVTSLGVNVYMQQLLEYIGIHPEKDVFTIKMSGGPDGDVAGNQLLNLYHYYPNTAKLIALTDGTGTIHDEVGLDLAIIKDLFYKNKGISSYPPEKLSDGGYLVDKSKKRHPSAYIQETLCWRKADGQVFEDWLSGSDTNHLLRLNVHQAKADIFIPAGGRPKTLKESNIDEFLDEKGQPTAKCIVEGANLYLTADARKILEKMGTLIVKDSSANKGGVICSSFEVLCGLALPDETFLANKKALVEEILTRIKFCASQEADLLLRTHKATGQHLTVISDQISDRINLFTYKLLDYLDLVPLSNSSQDPMVRCFLNYCLPTLRNKFTVELLNEIPEHHKKAIIARHIASYMVYQKGLDWFPSIVDILPLILAGSTLTSEPN